MTLRRSGFGRFMMIRKPPTAMTIARRIGLGLEVRPPRAAVLADCAGPAQACAKSEPHRNRHLLDMARGQRCLLRVPGVCIGGTDTTVACHSNLSAHGKAGARKADDEYHCAGCFACHTWLDAGPADATLKELAFMQAHLLQVEIWRAIVADQSQPAKDRAAAQWALDRLNASPVGLGPPL